MELHFLRSLWPRANRPLGGRYNIIQGLGAGGFGHTFLAQDLHLPGQPICVIKQLKPQVNSRQALQVARRLFDTEASVLYKLGTHPQIPQLLAHFEDNNEFYLAQELVQGHSLTEEFNARRTDRQVVAFLLDVLSTLTVVHQHRVIHRDLKPSNLIRRQHDQRIVLIDFGAVKQASTQLINAEPELASALALDSALGHTISIGTQGYMPNEQIAGRPQFSSDIYAVGVMGIQLLTGRHPRTLLPDPVTGELDWQHDATHTHPELIRVLNQMVCYDFRTRYATATDALSAIQSLPHELTQDRTSGSPLDKGGLGGINQGFEVQQCDPPKSPFLRGTLNPDFDQKLTRTSGSPLNEGGLGGINQGFEVQQEMYINGSRDEGKFRGRSCTIPETSGTTELASQTDRVRSLPRVHKSLLSGPFVLGTLGLGLMLGRVSPSPTSFAPSMAQSLPEIPFAEDISAAPLPEDIPAAPVPENPQAAIDRRVLLSLAHPTPISPKSGLSASVPSPQISELGPAERSDPSPQENVNPNRMPDLERSDDTNDDAPISQTPSHGSTQTRSQPSSQIPPQIQIPPQTQSLVPTQVPTQVRAQIPTLVQAQIPAKSQVPAQVPTQTQSQEPALAQTQTQTQEPTQAQTLWADLRENADVQARADLDSDSPLGAIAPLLDPLWRAENLRSANRHAEALIQYAAAIAQAPESVDAHVGQCFSLNSLQRYDDAVEACDLAIALDPTVSTAWSNRGAALWGLREFRLALASVEHSLALDPNNADAIQLQQTMAEGLES